MTTTETKVQHTPGPWSNNLGRIIVNSDDGPLCIADTHQSSHIMLPDGEREANAQLIAAASDLLSAAKDALESLKRLPNVDGAYRVTNIHQLELAITKAEQG